jgi:hypothetical protein
VIRTGPDGKKRQEVDVMEMEKKMVKQEEFVYRAYQIGVSQYNLEKNNSLTKNTKNGKPIQVESGCLCKSRMF